MEVRTSASASCTLRELINAVEPLPRGYALTGHDRSILDSFGGKPGILHLGDHPYMAVLEQHKALSPPAGNIFFKHTELFLRFSRMTPDTQDHLLSILCRLLWEKNLDRLEIEVQWSAHKTRHVQVERVPYSSMTGDRLALVFTMV